MPHLLKRRHFAALALAACAPMALTACDDSSAQTSESTSSASAPSQSPSSTIAPASGKRYDFEPYSVNIPTGWEKKHASAADTEMFETFSSPHGAPSGLAFVTQVNLNVWGTPSLRSQARDSIKSTRFMYGRFKKGPTIHEPVTVAGRKQYHWTGTVTNNVGETIDFDEYGSLSPNDYISRFTFKWDASYSPEEREQIAQSVLATVEWHGKEK